MSDTTKYVRANTAPLTQIYGPKAFIPVKKEVPTSRGFYSKIAIAGFLVSDLIC